MRAVLAISSWLRHDGDKCVRYVISIRGGEFSAGTETWGNVDEHLELASALDRFPASSESIVNFRFGTPGSGTCELHFHCTDALGHVGVWASFEGAYPVGRTKRHETASIFMRCDPSAIDQFVAGLRCFMAGSSNRATLDGLEA